MSFLATTYSSSNNSKPLAQTNYANKPLKTKSSLNKRISPKHNDSFKLNLSSKIFKNSRSASRDKTRNLSMNIMTPSNRKSASIQAYGLNTSINFKNIIQKAKKLEVSQEFRMKNQFIENWTNLANEEFRSGNYENSMKNANKVLKIEANSLKALFIRANCFIQIKKHKLAIPDLLSIIQVNPKYDKNIYIALAICFIEIGDYTTAIRQITKGIETFTNFVEGYINRGVLFNRQKRWDKAINDFHEAISINPNKGGGYIGLADALIGMGDHENALRILEQAFKDPDFYATALLKRGKIYFETQEFNRALRDLDKVICVQSENVEAFYYKAFALLGLKNVIDAGLCLEQVVKYDKHKKFTGPAIYNLGAIKIKQKDYYGAMFTFQRGVALGLEIEEQKVLKSYVEAILSLMKRKFKEGVNMLSKIIRGKHESIQEYIGNCYAFRGYGYASIEEHERAVKDLQTASSMQVLDPSSDFNLMISKAITISDKDPESALQLLASASKSFPNSVEPMAYISAIYFKMAQSKNKPELAEKSKEYLDAALKIRDSESDLYFFRGILLYYLGKTIEAVHDIEKAIDKAEDNVVDHFIARGLCSGKLKMYKEAMQDFSIAIKLNERSAEAYYYKGRCNFIIGDTNAAFEDFQKTASLTPDDPSVHIRAGNLLMLTGSVNDALKAFANANTKALVPQSLIQRAKCFIILDSLEEAFSELHSALKITQSNTLLYDYEVFEVLINSCSKEDLKKNLVKGVNKFSDILSYKHQGEICKSTQIHWYKGVFLFFVGDFQKAKAEFKQGIVNKDDSDEDESLEKENIELIYNIALIYMIGEYYEAALTNLNEIVHYLEGKDRGKILLLMGILHLGLEQHKEAKSFISEGFKFDPETIQMYLDERPEVKVLPLSCNSKYASFFPMAKLKIGESHPILLRPSFSLPKIELPNMEFEIEKELLERFTVKNVKCKPETPWLSRVKGSIQFTDEIQNIECEIVNDSNESNEIEGKSDDSREICSEKEIRRYKSESISLKDDAESDKNKSFEDSIEEILENIDDIEFY